MSIKLMVFTRLGNRWGTSPSAGNPVEIEARNPDVLSNIPEHSGTKKPAAGFPARASQEHLICRRNTPAVVMSSQAPFVK